MRHSLLIAAALITAAGTAQAQGLKDEAEIRNGLLIVGMAYEISRKCDDLDARTLRGIQTLFNLKSRARGLGYSSAEVDAYIDDKAEKDRLEGIARAQLAQLGVVADDPATYCAVGRDQIAKGTGVGALLR